jgi:di/tricarboxylate transporter
MILFAILAASVVGFAWGRWRHDMVALAALLASVAAGLVPAPDAFAGFGHPAVITVACVLVLSHGLQTSGAIDLLSRRVLPQSAKAGRTIFGLATLAAALSAFMNNVGALALVMPVALQAAERVDVPPARMLMPVAFGSILGGMTTLIGTPPNLIVAGYRRELVGESFQMFDFTPVGLAVAVVGLAFIGLVGWRLVPPRRRAGVEGFEAGAYFTEARVPEGAKAVGMTLREVEEAAGERSIQVLGLVRREVRLRAPRPGLTLRPDDILIIEAEPDGLSNALATLGIALEAAVKPDEEAKEAEAAVEVEATAAATGDADAEAEKQGKPRDADEADVVLAELVVKPAAPLIGRSARDINLRLRYQINLLAVSRQGERRIERLRTMPIAASDVLLVQGLPEAISEFAAEYGCLPLAERTLRLPDARRLWTAVGILALAVVAAASGIVPPQVSFAGGVLAAMATRVVPPRVVYTAIDWPVIVLLACLLPVAGAMLTTGAAELVARFVVENIAGGAAIPALALILIVTMTLSDVMNNAATVAVMAPIAYGASQTLGVSPDAFLMAVAIGGSCAFLTPIGHQNNPLILGPAGLRFGDYWRLGLPVEIIVVGVSVPMLILVWGL